MNELAWIIFIILGLLSLTRPVILVYLFLTVPLLSFAPILSSYKKELFLLELGPIDIYPYDYFLVILVAYIVFQWLRKPPLQGTHVTVTGRTGLSTMVIILIAWEIFIGCLSYRQGFEAQNVLRRLSTEALLLLIIYIPHIPDIMLKEERILKYIIVIAVLLVCFGLVKYAITNETELTSSDTIRSLSANSVIILMFAICYTLFRDRYQGNHISGTLILLAFLSFGIMLSGFRSGMLVLLLAIIMFGLSITYQRLELMWVPLLLLFIIGSVLWAPFVTRLDPGTSFLGGVVYRFYDTFDTENKTTKDRLTKWKFSFQVLREKPLIGLGRFPVHTDAVRDWGGNPHLMKFDELNRATHNLVMEKTVHEGLIGVTLMLGFLVMLIYKTYGFSLKDFKCLLILRYYFICLLVFSMFETGLTNATGKVYFAVAAGLLNAHILHKNQMIDGFPLRYPSNN